MKLADFIQHAVDRHNTSLGDNKAFPHREDISFEEMILSHRYKKILSLVEKTLGYIPSIDEASSLLSKTLTEIQKKEEPIKDQLEVLAKQICNQVLSVHDGTVLVDTKLANEIVPEVELRILPEDKNNEEGYTFEDVDEIEISNRAILKRRFINSLVQGASYCLMTKYIGKDIIGDLSEDLSPLYQTLVALNDFLLFNKQERISDKHPMLGAYVETHLGERGDKTIIKAQGMAFPLLLQETFRGYFELFASHGLPSDKKKANYIIHHADFMVAEAWDLRMGVGLWHKMKMTELDPATIPYVFVSLVKLKGDEFNVMSQNILANTKKGNDFIISILDQVRYDQDYQKFKQSISNMSIPQTVITDDEVSDDVLHEDIDFNQDIAISINCDDENFDIEIINGQKTIETRNDNRLDKLVGHKIGLIRTSKKNKPYIFASCVLGPSKRYDTPESFDSDLSYHQVSPDSNYHISKTKHGVKYGYPINDIEVFDTPIPVQGAKWVDGLYFTARYTPIKEGVEYANIYKDYTPYAGFRINSKTDDKSNSGVMNADTRIFANKQQYQQSNENTIRAEKEIENIFNWVINYAFFRGMSRYPLPEPSDYDNDLQRIMTKTINLVKRKIQEYGDDYEGLRNWAENMISRKSADWNNSQNTNNRLQNDNREKTFRYNLIPLGNTGINAIALFAMDDCNFSDAIKNGAIRPNSYNYISQSKDKLIPVLYDGEVEPNLENTFSVSNDPTNHQRQQFGYNDEKYTSVNQFMDKSIVYASTVLKENEYIPDYIVNVPSSSDYNIYYCKNLANKLGSAQYLPNFFQKNLFNLKNINGDDVISQMQHDGVSEKEITIFKTVVNRAAMSSISDSIAYPIRNIIKDNYDILSIIAKEYYSREKINMKVLERQVLGYAYNMIVKAIKKQPIEQVSMAKYITDMFMKQTRGLNSYNTYVLEEFKKRVNLKIGKKVLEDAISQMYELVNKYSEELMTIGYKIKFNQKWKITGIQGKARKYLKGLFVVADQYFNQNHELLESLRHSKFLIVDEDLDTGTSLINAVEALQSEIPLMERNNILGLVNCYYKGNS